MKNAKKIRKPIMAAICLSFAVCSQAQGNITIASIGKGNDWLKYDVLIDNKAILKFDLSQYKDASKEMVPNYYQGNTPSISPDNRHYAFVVIGDKSLAVILADVAEKKMRRVEVTGLNEEMIDIFRNQFLTKAKWINSAMLDTAWGKTMDDHIIINIYNGKCNIISDGSFLLYDRAGNNYVSVWGARYARISNPQLIPDYTDLPSQYIRYNGYWVYPRPIKGFITSKQKNEYYRDNKVFPDILELKNMDHLSVFSAPTFVGDSERVAFVEQIYSRKDKSIVGTYLVAIDAHEVSSNPPNLNHIDVKKKAIPAIQVECGYINFPLCVSTSWNKDSSSIQIFKVDKVSKEEMQIMNVFVREGHVF